MSESRGGPSSTMGRAEWLMLLALSALWGGSFYFIAVGLSGFPPLTLVLLRVAIAAVALHAALRLTGGSFPFAPEALLAYLGMGLLNNVLPFLLLTWGQKTLPSGLVSILNATTPLFTVVVAHVMTADERLTPGKIAGVAAGFAGAVLMIGPGALDGLGLDVAAEMACLAAALSYGIAGVFGRRFRRLGVSPMATAAGMLSASALILAPIAMLVDRPLSLPAPSGEAWTAVVALALVSTALAYILYFRILARAGATNLVLVTFLIPITAILLGTWRLGETLRPLHFAGMALIGLGLAFIDGRLLARLRTGSQGGAARPS